MVHRVLLIEDEPDLVDVLGELLRERGDDVAVAGSLAEAAEALRGFSPCVIVSDLTLPDGSGIDAARTLRRLAQGVPLYLMSAVPATELTGLAREAGANGAIAKPFELSEFEQAVSSGCADRESASPLL
jgi:two-component system OmpR family response regulator